MPNFGVAGPVRLTEIKPAAARAGGFSSTFPRLFIVRPDRHHNMPAIRA
jgi:hypothetical protein